MDNGEVIFEGFEGFKCLPPRIEPMCLRISRWVGFPFLENPERAKLSRIWGKIEMSRKKMRQCTMITCNDDYMQ